VRWLAGSRLATRCELEARRASLAIGIDREDAPRTAAESMLTHMTTRLRLVAFLRGLREVLDGLTRPTHAT
jgi:hypothetical protein